MVFWNIVWGEVVTVSALEEYIFVKSCERFEVEASKSTSSYLMDARSRDWYKLWYTNYFNIYIYAYIYMVQINSAQKSLPPITTPNGSHPGSLLSTARPFVIGERYSCRVKSWWKCSNVSRCIIVHSNAFGSSSTDVEPECVCSLGMSDDSDSSRCFLVFLKRSQQWHSRNQPWDQLKAVSVDRNQNYRHHWLRDPPLSHLHVHVSYVVLYFCCSFSAPQFLHAQLQRWVFGCVRWIRCHYWCSIEVLLR